MKNKNPASWSAGADFVSQQCDGRSLRARSRPTGRQPDATGWGNGRQCRWQYSGLGWRPLDHRRRGRWQGFLADPFASEQPLFTITAANAAQYKDKLSAGQLAMLERYADSYKNPGLPHASHHGGTRRHWCGS